MRQLQSWCAPAAAQRSRAEPAAAAAQGLELKLLWCSALCPAGTPRHSQTGLTDLTKDACCVHIPHNKQRPIKASHSMGHLKLSPISIHAICSHIQHIEL